MLTINIVAFYFILKLALSSKKPGLVGTQTGPWGGEVGRATVAVPIANGLHAHTHGFGWRERGPPLIN